MTDRRLLVSRQEATNRLVATSTVEHPRPSFAAADYELAISLAACHKFAAWRSNEGSAARTKIALAPNAPRGWQSHSGLSPIIQIGAPGIEQRSAASNIWACGFS